MFEQFKPRPCRFLYVIVMVCEGSFVGRAGSSLANCLVLAFMLGYHGPW